MGDESSRGAQAAVLATRQKGIARAEKRGDKATANMIRAKMAKTEARQNRGQLGALGRGGKTPGQAPKKTSASFKSLVAGLAKRAKKK